MALAANRLAVLSQPNQPTVIVAATEGGVVGLEAHGRTVWSAHLPVSLGNTMPTGVAVGPHIAYVTFQVPEGSPAGSIDVVAIALGRQGAPLTDVGAARLTAAHRMPPWSAGRAEPT